MTADDGGPEDTRPDEFRLLQNWPNPFNPATRLGYALDRGARVELVIYNVAGQKVRTLDAGFREPGVHTLVWDGCDDHGRPLAAGVYLYRLRADDRILVKKMVMLDGAVARSGGELRQTGDIVPVPAADPLPAVRYTVEVSAPGIAPYRGEGIEAAEDQDVDVTVARTRTAAVLASLPEPVSAADVTAILRAMGIAVSDDPRSTAGLAPVHASAIASLYAAQEDLTIDELARELAASGIRFAGAPPTAAGLASLLNGAVQAAYEIPENPFALLPLYLARQADGSMPSIPPVWSADTHFDAVRASLALAAVNAAAHLPPAAGPPTPSEGDLKGEILDAWTAEPPRSRSLGEDLAAFVGTYGGGMAGLALAAGARAGVSASGDSALEAPYLVGGHGVAGSTLGRRAVVTLYRWVRDRIGTLVPAAEIAGLVLGEDGLAVDGVPIAPGFHPNPGEIQVVDLPGGRQLEFVWIEPGTFTMGTTPEQEEFLIATGLGSHYHVRHELVTRRVTISRGFWLGKYEVTQEVWDGVMGSSRDAAPDSAQYPAVHLSWRDVQRLIARLNKASDRQVYRLPTEAEWEYACRAGTQTLWSFGDDVEQLKKFAWYNDGTGGDVLGPVGLKRPNPWGLFDMHGNAAEWCWDWIAAYPAGDQVDPTGPASGVWRVYRSVPYQAGDTRSAYRLNALPDDTNPSTGARLVATFRPASVRGPQADAGADLSIEIGPPVALDGRDSWGGAALVYRWQEDPENPVVDLLSDPDAVAPTFEPSVPGTYRFILRVDDGARISEPDTTIVSVTPCVRDVRDTTFVLPGGTGMEFVWIEPWSFIMGTTEAQEDTIRWYRLWHDGFEDEHPAHRVTLSQGFWLGKYEITQGQWESVVETDGRKSATPDRPAGMSLNDMQAWIDTLNARTGSEVYRLPTEAEWEYACRAGTQTLWFFGNDVRELGRYAWYSGGPVPEDGRLPARVGTRLPNPWGLFDMYGSVAEWVGDGYWPYAAHDQVDPFGPTQDSRYRIDRGGTYAHFLNVTRSAVRGTAVSAVHTSSPYFGARLVRTVPCLPPDPALQADAGADQRVDTGALGRLDGSASRSDRGGDLEYLWWGDPRNPEPGLLDDVHAATPTFRPRLAGTYRFMLRVRADRPSAPDTVVVRVTHGDAPAGRDTVFILPGDAQMEFVRIEPGTFAMGTTPEQVKWLQDKAFWRDDWGQAELPAHPVTISRGFWIGKYEITQRQWESVMGTRPWRHFDTAPLYPATEISWDDFQQMIGRLNEAAGADVYRLPTEAEWEYACRTGTQTLWFFGDDLNQLDQYAWYYDRLTDLTLRPVGIKRPNPWGLFDMYGNVREWCQDWWAADYYTDRAVTDPAGPESGSMRVVRGGDLRDDGRRTRSSWKVGTEPDSRGNYSGARLVRTD